MFKNRSCILFNDWSTKEYFSKGLSPHVSGAVSTLNVAHI
jgi:hypothetical protein